MSNPPQNLLEETAVVPAVQERVTPWLRRLEEAIQFLAVPLIILEHGGRWLEQTLSSGVSLFSEAALSVLIVSLLVRWRRSPDRADFQEEWRVEAVILGVWLIGIPLVWPFFSLRNWSEACLFLYSLAGAVRLLRWISIRSGKPALVFVGSFAALISLGTVLLMLPVCRAPVAGQVEAGADWRTALFTSTSASCVTGLAVVDTGTYWSRTGQLVIAGLIQVGGLGIMTFGAFFAMAYAGGLQFKETAFLGNLYEYENLRQARRLIWAILTFTFGFEFAGLILLASLPADLPLSERVYFGLFHSVASFCNAGFGLYPANMEGHGQKWQVWGVMAGLIIVGGLGFVALQDVASTVGERYLGLRPPGPRRRPRGLTVHTRLVFCTTAVLLVLGTVFVLLLEWDGVLKDQPPAEKVANAWFQSVTCRTAGFNTVPQDRLQPNTKLLCIILMFIGASPGSCGGGIRTVTASLAFLTVVAVLRGRDRVTVSRRRIPDSQVQRAAMIITLGMTVIMVATFLLVGIERNPDRFLDHLFEATSAFSTTGLSTIGTGTLKPQSQLVLIATMFLGRVGPLTLLVAVSRGETTVNYDYPREKVMLG